MPRCHAMAYAFAAISLSPPLIFFFFAIISISLFARLIIFDY